MTTPTMAVKVLRAPRVRRGNISFNLSLAVLAVMTLAAIFAPAHRAVRPRCRRLRGDLLGPDSRALARHRRARVETP